MPGVHPFPCERLFSSSKHVADDRRASLGSTKFEELQLMKFTWHNNILDMAAWNSIQTEEVKLDEYQELLNADEFEDELEEEVDVYVLEE